MQAIDVLREKGTRVVTIEPTATLGELVRLLAWEGVGSAVVVEGERVCGVISERDVVRALADGGGEAMKLVVGRRMVRRMVSCAGGDGLEEILRTMTELGIRHLPVMEGDQLVGVISLSDVVKARLEETEAEAGVLREFVTAH